MSDGCQLSLFLQIQLLYNEDLEHLVIVVGGVVDLQLDEDLTLRGSEHYRIIASLEPGEHLG